ncbi:Mut7-C RNAse domain-containing protein [Pontibacter sp. CAU 1760]
MRAVKDKVAYFTLQGSLKDFLPVSRLREQLPYAFSGSPAVKDAIEAIGVPHPEVFGILVNGTGADFHYSLQAGDMVKVYAAECLLQNPGIILLQPDLPVPVSFVLDVHMGKLARSLRMLGFDSSYANDYTDSQIAAMAASENRVVLTRDVGLLKQKIIRWGYWLRSQQPEEQLREVLQRFRLTAAIRSFTRCMACNGVISSVPKHQVLAQLQPKTKAYFDQFYQCLSCGQVYWKGSHYEKMLAKVKTLETSELGNNALT